MTAVLVRMSLGGILGTMPSEVAVGILGWVVFQPHVNPLWGAVALTFPLTVIALYALGILLSSLFLAYGREAESLNHFRPVRPVHVPDAGIQGGAAGPGFEWLSPQSWECAPTSVLALILRLAAYKGGETRARAKGFLDSAPDTLIKLAYYSGMRS